jgi:ATP-dependent DNA helicase DinG
MPESPILDADAILGPGGKISKRIARYEHRREQMQMADAVSRALDQRSHLIVEAGTGVGKSFGYLVPAILFATAAESSLEPAAESLDDPGSDQAESQGPKLRRIVVSTHTISLQEQLIGKDLPLLNAVIPREFSSVLVKGRGNYLSKRRLQLASLRGLNLFSGDADFDQLQQIESWARSTSDGSLSSLSFKPSSGLWDEIASDSGNCMGRKCKQHASCFYYAARRRVQNAQILVVNHALFFSDLAVRAQGGGILPKYDAVIFDECHTIEAVAGEHLGLSISNTQIDYTLRKLYNPRNDKGILAALGLKQLSSEVFRCMEAIDDLVADLSGWLGGEAPANGRVRAPLAIQTTLVDRLTHVSGQLERFGKDLNDANAKLDMMSASARLAAIAMGLDQWLLHKQENAVYWIERSESRAASQRGTVRMTLRSSPLDVGDYLREHLFRKTPSVIMTSATVSTGKANGFSFFQKRLGAVGSNTLQLGSPFDYQRLAEVHLLTDVPDPSGGRGEYESAILPALRHYIGLADGHAFLLFTSYDSLRKCCAALKPWLDDHNLAIYSQADGTPRTELLRAFREQPRGVLFGAESFWQGVDVPGDALRLVVMTKLPFSVPDHPLLEARLESIRDQGGNPFRDFQLPEAVIKFRQGFGRLIRTATDSGIVLVTDPRILQKPYGKTFLDGLPDCPKHQVSAKRFLK